MSTFIFSGYDVISHISQDNKILNPHFYNFFLFFGIRNSSQWHWAVQVPHHRVLRPGSSESSEQVYVN